MAEEYAKYTTHIIELTRNNGMVSIQPDNYKNIFNLTKFLMFDYFDILLYRELTGADKHYKNYFSIENPFKNISGHKVSYKSLSLYSKASDKATDVNPFTNMRKDIPFLGLIQISLCEDTYKNQSDDANDIEAFLSRCEKGIMSIIENNIDYNQNNCILKIYRSSTTGDFCLVVRTDSVERIYSFEMALNDTQYNSEYNMNILSYTNVGIKCDMNDEKNFAPIDSDFIKNHNMTFALRISADKSLKSTLSSYIKKSSVTIQNFNGLFGRYNYLLNIDMKTFAEIFPFLCAKKFGTPIPSSDNTEIEGNLKKVLNLPQIRNLNERIIIQFSSDFPENKLSTETKPKDTDNSQLIIVNSRNQTIYNKISDINKLVCLFFSRIPNISRFIQKYE